METQYLNLGCTHAISSNLSQRDKDGDALTKYIISINNSSNEVGHSLFVDPQDIPLFEEMGEVVSNRISAMKVRPSHDIAAFTTNLPYDMRSLSYICGAVLGRVAAGAGVNYVHKGPCKGRTIGSIWNNPAAGNLLVSASLIKNSCEWVTLACLANLAGATSLVYLSDTMPPNSTTLAGPQLGSFVLRVHANILSCSDIIGGAAHHQLAFFRGLCSTMTLHGHSDEGGASRDILFTANYPIPHGMLVGLSPTVGRLPVYKDVHHSELSRWAIAYLLRGAALWSASAIDEQGDCVVLYAGDEDVACNIDGFKSETMNIMGRWRSLCNTIDEFMTESAGDDRSIQSYLHKKKHDSHFSNEYISPFYWINPDFILPDGLPFRRMAVPGKTVYLPLFDDVRKVRVTTKYEEVEGRVLPDNVIQVDLNTFKPRFSGISYILHERYNELDGLHCLRQCTHEADRTADTLMFCDQDAVNHFRQRWRCPHSSVPHPMEAISPVRCLFNYYHPGTRDYPNSADFSKAMVASRCGSFSLFKTGEGYYPEMLSSRLVPPALRKFVNTKNDSIFTPIEEDNEFVDSPPLPPAPTSMPELPPPPELSEGESHIVNVEASESAPSAGDSQGNRIDVPGDSEPGVRSRPADVQAATND
jgi:hypothetical protein